MSEFKGMQTPRLQLNNKELPWVELETHDTQQSRHAVDLFALPLPLPFYFTLLLTHAHGLVL